MAVVLTALLDIFLWKAIETYVNDAKTTRHCVFTKIDTMFASMLFDSAILQAAAQSFMDN